MSHDFMGLQAIPAPLLRLVAVPRVGLFFRAIFLDFLARNPHINIKEVGHGLRHSRVLELE